MDTKRQSKISRLIQRELSEIFQKEGSAIIASVMVTVTLVRISPDLSSAKVYLSLFPAPDKKESLKQIVSKAKNIRFELGKRLKNQLRIIPELFFYIDDTLDYIENIDNLLKE